MRFFNSAFLLSMAVVLIRCGSAPPAAKPTEPRAEFETVRIGGEPQAPANVKYAGARSSSYGIAPFPKPTGWLTAINEITAAFPGSAPALIWIVGEMGSSEDRCKLFFPSDAPVENVEFTNVDKHEKFLAKFDEAGIKVFLQVEPGNADMETLIDLVLGRYGHHSSVIGFGVDVEWYKADDAASFKKGWGSPVTDQEAKAWDEKVKSHNPGYRMFLKHWDAKWMPSTYKSDIVFVNDSQEIADLDAMVAEFQVWAERFAPNEVWYQIGYESDKRWWQQYEDPVKKVGRAIAEKVAQDTGIMWVDFTLRDVVSTRAEKGDGVVVDPDNLAHGRPAVSSEIEAAGFEAAMALDSDEATRWSSKDEDPAWMYIDLGKTTDIERIELVWEASYSKEYNIDVSDDAQTWTTVHEERDGKGGLEKIEPKNAKGRYLRIFGLKRFFQKKEYGHSLWEVRVYGK